MIKGFIKFWTSESTGEIIGCMSLLVGVVLIATLVIKLFMWVF